VPRLLCRVNARREAGAGCIDAFDVFGPINPGNDGNVGRQVFDNDGGKQRRRIRAQRENNGLDRLDARFLENSRIDDVADEIHASSRVLIDHECLFASVL
jgi:hypothetical protein